MTRGSHGVRITRRAPVGSESLGACADSGRRMRASVRGLVAARVLTVDLNDNSDLWPKVGVCRLACVQARVCAGRETSVRLMCARAGRPGRALEPLAPGRLPPIQN